MLVGQADIFFKADERYFKHESLKSLYMDCMKKGFYFSIQSFEWFVANLIIVLVTTDHTVDNLFHIFL